jgi:hypothetical protein
MRRINFILLIAIVLAGCSHAKPEPAVIKIGSIKITQTEFEQAYKVLTGKPGDPASKKEFLDTFISRKLILREAERLGLDRDPAFLSDIQLFWEQSLLKLVLDRKIKELATAVSVNDDEVIALYNAHRDAEFKGKDIAAVYDEIKYSLLKEKQRQAIQEWVNSLRGGTRITTDDKKLGLE